MAKAAKKAAAAKKAPKAKPEKAAGEKAAGKKSPKKTANMLDPETRQLFMQDLAEYKRLLDAVSKAQSKLRRHGKTIKADGFTMAQVKFAIQCETPEGEKTARAMIANNLLAAAYTGADIGEQLSLFLDEPRVPAVDRAYKEGEAAAAANQPAKPGYDPSTAQYRQYMEGYHAEQARQLKGGIKPLDKGPKLITKAEKDAASKKDAGPPSPPKPIISKGLTHKEQSKADQALKEQAKETAEKYFKPPTTGDFGTA